MTSSTSTSTDLSPAQHAVAEHLRLTSTGETRAWVDLFAPDGVLEFPYAPEGLPRSVQGHDALFAHMTHFPDTFDVEFVDLVLHETASPLLAVAEFRSVGTAVPTGKPYEQTCISVVHTDADGLITRYVDYWNPLVAMEALAPESTTTGSEVAEVFFS